MAINYQVCEGGHAKLEDIHQKCNSQFSGMAIPTKETLAKYIRKLFDITSELRYKGKTKYTVYKLSEKVANESTNESTCCIKVSENCTLNINEGQLVFDTEYIVNGKAIQHYISFGLNGMCIMNIFNTEIQLKFPVSFTQDNIDALTRVLIQINLCKGIKSNSESTTSTQKLTNQPAKHETWRNVLKPEWIEVRMRSKTCRYFLSVSSASEICPSCLVMERMRRKRKMNTTKEKKLMQKTKGVDESNKENQVIDTVNLTEQNQKLMQKTKDVDESNKENQAIDTVNLTEQNHDIATVDLTEQDHNDMQQILDSILSKGNTPPDFRVLLESQLANSKESNPKQRRWDPKIISICLSIYCRSPQAYKDLGNSGMLLLPSKRLLQYYKNSVKQSPGIVEDNLEWMHKEAEKKGVVDHGRHGGLLIDEMTIQDDLQIVRQGDSWIILGSVDMGTTNNNINVIIDQTQKVKMATHCLQITYHGFTGFRWPVAYYASETACAYQINNIFWEVLSKLEQYGFFVDYINMDGASANRSFMNMLSSDLHRNKYIISDIYNVDHKICVIQDVKHVLKKVRNNLESSRHNNKSKNGRYLLKGTIPIVWEHWLEAYKFNIQSGFPIHRKLTDEHFFLTPVLKMRNGLAADVLNNEMLYLMKCYQATLTNQFQLAATVELLENTSVLVEVFHDKRPIANLSDKRLKDVCRVLEYFNDWQDKVTSSDTHSVKKNLITSQTREDINSSIQGFVSLCDISIKNGNSVNPGYINSDLIENNFCQQRGIRNGNNTNPTLAQFGPAQTAICLGQISVSSKCNSGTSASYFKATTPCALNPGRNRKNSKPKPRSIRL